MFFKIAQIRMKTPQILVVFFLYSAVVTTETAAIYLEKTAKIVEL